MPEVVSTLGPYQLVRRLGAGGMGVVYLGHDQTSGATAAVKRIWPEHAADPTYRARLRREVEIARQIPRFCTAPVLASDLASDQPWVATEYIDGLDLDLVLLRCGRLAGTDLETLAVGVAVALRAIHQYGIIHRDLKPSNILLSWVGPRVIDFGIARYDDYAARTRLTQTGVVVGTPAYMAPEQLTGGQLTAAVDVFAWAGVVVRAGTGRPPFGNGYAALEGIVHQPPYLGDLAEPLRSLVTAAFHKDPACRPSAAELVDRLSQTAKDVSSRVIATAGVPAGAPPPGTTSVPLPSPGPPPFARPRRRWPFALSVACVAVAAVTAIATTTWLTRAEPPPAEVAAQPTPGAPPFGTELFALATDDPDLIYSVAVGELDGIPVAVAGGSREIAIWDLTTGELVDRPFQEHYPGATLVELVDLAGAPMAIIGRYDHSVEVWDLVDRVRAGDPPPGHVDYLESLAVGELAGTPVVLSGSRDGTVRVWDLTTGQQVGEPITGPAHRVEVVLFGTLAGIPVAVTQVAWRSEGDRVQVWDLATGQRIGEPFPDDVWMPGLPGGCCGSGMRPHAFVEVGGTPTVISSDLDGALVTWDLRTGEFTADPLAGHSDSVRTVAVGELGGTPIAVSAGDDRTVRVWDLTTGQQIGAAFSGHTGMIRSVSIGDLAGMPVAISGADDGVARVWSLASPDYPD